MSSNLRADLKKCVDSALSVRDKIGATVHQIFFVTRTWSGEDIGDGVSTVVRTLMAPSPQIVDYGLDLRLQTGGSIRQGDLVLKGISCNKYSRAELHTQTEVVNIEKFYEINQEYYDLIHIKEKFVTWEIHLRKTSERDRRNF